MTNIAQVAVEALQLFGDTSLFVNEFAEAGLDWGGVGVVTWLSIK